MLKKVIIGSPFERLARRLYLRMDYSVGGLSERDILPILKRSLRPNSNCIDIGAHRGTILEEILALSPGGVHYAFEPIPSHYEYLKKQYPSVQVFPLALSDTKTEKQFTHVLDRPTRSGFIHAQTLDEPVELITVHTELLDNLIPTTLAINFIKIDVEGAEFEVLQGSQQTIIRNRPIIYFEHNQTTCAPYGVNSADIYGVLVDYCRLNLWMPKMWLKGEPPLSLDAFIEAAKFGYSFNFLACDHW
ncbi:MAG TPA: FkbM family methyltransferase [Anaerolineaceae bacterium]|nr:FkbM family methyltransferase [Anaerolineaceae bacterium]